MLKKLAMILAATMLTVAPALAQQTLKIGNNHFLIQNIYVAEAVKTADGSMGLHAVEVIVANSQDAYHDKCPMK